MSPPNKKYFTEDEKRLSRIYNRMKQRCYDKNCSDYKWYGAKGVIVCEEWLLDKSSFLSWAMQKGYKSSLQLDKDILCKEAGLETYIYSPATCLWVTQESNKAEHRKKIERLTLKGERITIFDSVTSANESIGRNPRCSAITKVAQGRRKFSANSLWRFVDE